MADPSVPKAGEIEAVAARLGIELPPECIAGVRHHTGLLDEHWANLRAFALPPA